MRASTNPARRPSASPFPFLDIDASPPLRGVDVVPMVPPLPGHVWHGERLSLPASRDSRSISSAANRDAVAFAKFAILTIALVAASVAVGIVLGQAGAIGVIR